MSAIALLHTWNVDGEVYLHFIVNHENLLKRCTGTRSNASVPFLYNFRFAIEGDTASNYTFSLQNTNSRSRSSS